MHLELLVEDMSGKKTLENLVPRLIRPEDTFRIHSYKGIGDIPRNMKNPIDASRRILLENVPKLLRGYGQTFASYPASYPASVILVCDLDDRTLKTFLKELNAMLNQCEPKPQARFCIAIEEGEAWFLGDLPAIKKAYPNAKDEVLESYVNDSICGTWELLADALYQGGKKLLIRRGWQAVGTEKYRWAEAITPGMEMQSNRSPSFQFFCETVRQLCS